MALTYRALAQLLTYPTADMQSLAADIARVLSGEGLLRADLIDGVSALARHLAAADIYDVQEAYIDLFDRSRSLSLNLYEHVHGESRERGQAMAALVELYASRGLELDARELPDYLPVFLEFLSTLSQPEAASLLGEAVHVLEALSQRLGKRESPYRAVFDALVALAGVRAEAQVLAALLAEPEDNPDDLDALDRQWAEQAVTFGPGEAGCPKAEALVAAMQADEPAPRRAAGGAD
ncbi:MAG TPA: nitrate reductase molybdenum cofactor assembly chaperone [Asticcacaulis sp.]